RLQALAHALDLVGHLLLGRPLGRARLGAVVDAGRVQGGHAAVDPLAAEEVAVVVEEQLVIVDVGVVEGHPQRPRLGLEGAGGEGGDVEAAAPGGGGGRRGRGGGWCCRRRGTGRWCGRAAAGGSGG